MTFPVWIKIGSLVIHPHIVFESLAYFIGFRVYLAMRKHNPVQMPKDKGLFVLVGAIIGGALGSKVLYWLEDPVLTLANWKNLMYLMEGKSIVGGLLGGLIGVELTKKIIGWKRSTGDDMALPLILGMMIGRIGCFLSGLDDHTHGTPTTWITGIDFGDGIARHPAQLYEIVFLACLAALLLVLRGREKRTERPLPNGRIFQLFMFSYLLFRLLIDFIKPVTHFYGGLNSIQAACLLGLLYYSRLLVRKPKEKLHA